MNDSPAERARQSRELRIAAVLDLGEDGDGLRATAHMANPVAIPVRVVLEPGGAAGPAAADPAEEAPQTA